MKYIDRVIESLLKDGFLVTCLDRSICGNITFVAQ